MPERELLVRIVGDDRDLQRALSSTDRRLQQIDSRTAAFGRNISRGFAAAGVTIGTAAVFDQIGDAIDAASDLNEQVSKSRQIFGDASRDIEEWSETTADAFGVSQREALAATGTFGNLLRVVGLAPAEAGKMSRALVELAADLASFNNADPSEVLRAIQSGLVGEVEPLRRYGVLLSEARVQQVAMANTGKDNVKELTNQEKALARYELILRDTGPAQGDFARTSESLANQSRRLRAQLDDLSANLGQVFVPAMTGAVAGLNEFLDAMEGGVGVVRNFRDELKGIDWDIPAPPSWMRTFVFGDDVRDLLFGVSAATPEAGPAAKGPGQGIGEDIQRRAEEAAKEAEEARVAVNRAARRREKAFNEFIKGQELKLDQSALTKSLQDDLAVLRAIEQAILRRIAQEGRTFKLVEQLTRVRLEIQRTTEDAADEARQAAEDAFHATVDALNLDLEIAQASRSFEDDQAALRALEQALLRQIQSEGESTDLLRQLFNVREEQKRVAEQLAEQKRERRNRRQFLELGLTEEGERPTPGTGALLRRTRSLQDQIKGTVLDTNKTRQQLARIAQVLTDNFRNVGKDVRQAILDMLNDISSALEGEGSRQGPLTKTSGLNTKRLLAGLGLSPEEINALRGRLSGLNTSGNQLAGLGTPPGATTGTGLDSFGGAQGRILVESHTTINLDGQQVARVVTKQQQKTDRRNPKQKRGPNRNR